MLNDMTKSNNTAIIVAAGIGSRLSSDIPKQYLKLKDVEILAYSVRSFKAHPEIDEVIIVTSANYLEHVSKEYPECNVVKGGATRQDSVFKGLQACSPDTHIVLVHDAARPLIPSRVIDRCLSSLEKYEGVAPALKPVDSMIQLDDSGFRNLRRENLRIIQTPQCFHIDILRAAHASGIIDTDELGLVKQSNPQVRLGFIEGEPQLMKLTSSRDFDLIKLYLSKESITA